MLPSVSGWSGPSLAFFRASVSSWSLRASACRPRACVAVGQVVHALERVGVVGAEVPAVERPGRLELPRRDAPTCPGRRRSADRPPQPGLGQRLAREAVLDRGQGGGDGVGQLHVVAQAALLTLGAGGGEDLVLDEAEYRLDRLLRLLLLLGGRQGLARGKAFALGRRDGFLLLLLGVEPGQALRLGRASGLEQAPGRPRDPRHQRQHDQARRDHPRPVLPDELPQPIRPARRRRQHRLRRQVTQDVGPEAVGRLVPPGPVLLQRLHHDPVEVPAQRPLQVLRVDPAVGRDAGQGVGRAHLGARLRRVDLADHPQHLQQGARA